MVRIELPGRMPLLSGAVPCWPCSDATIIDLSRLTFVTPFDLVGLATLVLATPPDASFQIIPPTDPSVANYLLRMDLLQLIGGRVDADPPFAPELPRLDVERASLIELRLLRHADDIEREAEVLWPRLRARLPETVCRSLFEILGELVDNAATHGQSDVGTLIAAQYYSGTTSGMQEGFWIGVSDAGVGVRQHLRRNPRYASIATDVDAIRLAVQPWVTGTTDRRGWGLRSVLEGAGELAPGLVTIRSGIGEGTFYIRDRVQTARYRVTQPIPGTWVHVLAGHREDGP